MKAEDFGSRMAPAAAADFLAKQVTGAGRAPGPGATDEGDESELPFEALSPIEAAQLKKGLVSLSLTAVLGWQALAGLLVAAAFWLWGRSAAQAFSALYGALAAVLPGIVFARGLKRQLRANLQATSQAPLLGDRAALGGFFVLEFVKVVLTVAMLAAAPWAVASVNWLALVVGFIVPLKVYWVVGWLVFKPRRANKTMG